MDPNSTFKSLLALLSLVVLSSFSFAQKQISDTIHLDNSETVTGFDKLNAVAGNYRVFITGENHTYLESNSKLWVQQIKYLHENAGVRNVMIEYGYASGWLINEYIQTGDSTLLAVLKDYSFSQYADAYVSLRKFNESLDPAERVSVVGIDLERGVYSASKVLSLQLPDDREPHDSIALDVESLRSLVSYNDNEIFDEESDYNYYNSYSARNTLDRVLQNFNSNKPHYKEFLGDRFDLFERILSGFSDMKTWREYEADNSTHQFVFREKYMFDRFREEFNQRNGNFFGQFGRCHTAKSTQEQNSCNWYHFKSLANRIEESPELSLQKKVMTLGILYKSDRYDDEVWGEMEDHIDSLFKLMPKHRVALYDLPSDTSLFVKMKDYFDYVFLNSTRPDSEYPYVDPDEPGEDEIEPRNKIMLSAGTLNIDLSDLNKAMSNFSNPFEDQLFMIGAEIVTTNGDRAFIQSNLTIMGFLGQERKFSNALNMRDYTARLAGFFMNNFTAFNLTHKQPKFDFMPGFGLGYSRLKLNILETAQNLDIPMNNEGFIGESKHSEYTNPAITFSLNLEMDVNIKSFTFGATGGYQFDLSKKRWLAEELMSSGPETSLQGWFAQFHLGFSFKD